MKHLKVKAELHPLKDTFSLTVLELTHSHEEFSDKSISGRYHSGVFPHNDIFLVGCPSDSTSHRLIGSTYIDIYLAKVGDVIRDLPASKWQEIREAIEAYNKWGATQ